MISIMDRGVGQIFTAIQNKGIMNNTIIMFYRFELELFKTEFLIITKNL